MRESPSGRRTSVRVSAAFDVTITRLSETHLPRPSRRWTRTWRPRYGIADVAFVEKVTTRPTFRTRARRMRGATWTSTGGEVADGSGRQTAVYAVSAIGTSVKLNAPAPSVVASASVLACFLPFGCTTSARSATFSPALVTGRLPLNATAPP